MRRVLHSKITTILLIFAISIMFCMPVFAEGEGDDLQPQDPVDPPAPSIHTVVRAWDVLSDSEDTASLGSEEQSAQVFKYIEYELDEEKAAEVDRLVDEAEERDRALAEQEARKLAEELVANGRYKELIGENNRYEKEWQDWYDSEDDEYDEDDESADDEDDEDYEDDEDEENIHSEGPYYSTLKDKYPHILEFWFGSDGKYYYDYDVDYSGIDFDSIYIEIPHDTFHIVDSVNYKDFAPQSKYSIKAQLVKIEISESNEYSIKEVIKELETDLGTDDTTEGEFSLDFGELKLDYGSYVILINVTDSEGVEYLSHNDLKNNYESVQVDNHFMAFDAAAKNGARRNRGEGFIQFPKGSPDTGDENRSEIALYILAIFLSFNGLLALTIARRPHYNKST